MADPNRKSLSPEYRAWQDMRQRCANPRHARYEHYGARGVSVCERWQRFEDFLADVGPRPGVGFSLGRVDNAGNYEPDNVEWQTQTEQINNRRAPRKSRYYRLPTEVWK